MNKKISQFNEVIGLSDNAYFTIVSGTGQYKQNYIISKDNLITEILGDIDTQVSGLTHDLNTEIQNRIDGETVLYNQLTGETEDRINADTVLYNLIQTKYDTGHTHSNYVPYTGATQDVVLGNHTLQTDGIKIDTVTPYVVQNPGEIGWNDVDGTFDMKLLNNTTLQAGQEMLFYGKAQGNILNGDVVQFAGVQGNHFLIKKAIPSEIYIHPEYLMGVATDNINNNNYGYVTAFGKVNDVYTYSWTLESPVLYFDFVNGNLTNVEPQAPTRRIIVASVIKLQTGNSENGVIFVRPTFGLKLVDLDDVNGTPLTTSGQILVWDNDRQVFDFTDNINNYSPTEHTHSYLPLSGGTINGVIIASGFTGDGSGLTNIPASGVTDLNLDRISSGDSSAIISSSGLTVNTGVTATSFITSGGTSNQFVKGDGTLDSNGYLPLSGGTMFTNSILRIGENPVQYVEHGNVGSQYYYDNQLTDINAGGLSMNSSNGAVLFVSPNGFDSFNNDNGKYFYVNSGVNEFSTNIETNIEKFTSAGHFSYVDYNTNDDNQGGISIGIDNAKIVEKNDGGLKFVSGTETPKDLLHLGWDNTVFTNPITIQPLSGSSYTYSKEPISITYTDLYNLVTTSGLTVGQRYIINDYQTIHTIPNTVDTNTGQVEPLVVEALTVNKLKNECYSTLFPEDIIYYDIENNQTMVPGCTKGYIYRRVDTIKNNDIGFDYRNVKFRRWQLNVTNEDADGDNNTYTKGNVVKKTGTVEVYIKLNNTQGLFSDTSKWKRFEFDNLTYIIPQEGDWYLIDESYQVILPNSGNYNDFYMFSTQNDENATQSSYDNIYNNKFNGNNSKLIRNSNTVFFGNNFSYNTIGNKFNNNTIGNNFNYNSIGNKFISNTIGNNFNYNTIWDNFVSNTIGNDFSYNTIGNNFNNNAIGDNFNSNTIGDYFSSNTIGNNFDNNTTESGFNINTIGNNFNNNAIGDNFNSNTIGNDFSSNTIGNNFSYNTIGNDFQNNTIGNDFYYNSIGNKFNNNTIGNNFYSNTIVGYFNSNTIGYNFNYNTIGSDLNSNTIGNNFYSNTIGNDFSYNTIGNDFYYNSIGSNFYFNTIGNNFNYNTIGNNFNYNTIGDDFNYNGGLDFTSSTYVYQGYNKELFTNYNHIPYLKYYDGNNVLQIVQANL